MTAPFDTIGGDVGSLDHLTAAARAADADTDVDRVILHFRGQGTTADGLMNAANTILGMEKPTAAWVEVAHSGFGVLALMADTVVGPSTASLGSLSVFQPFTEAPEPLPGQERIHVFSPSLLKSAMAAGQLTEDVEKEMGGRAEDLFAAVFPIVAEARSLSPTRLKAATSGGTFIGRKAMKAGLLDGIFPTFQDFVEHFSQKETVMSEIKNAALPAAAAGSATSGSTAADDAADDAADAAAGSTDDGRLMAFLRSLSPGNKASAAATAVPSPASAVAVPADLEARLDALAGTNAALQSEVKRLTERASKADVASMVDRVAACASVPRYTVEMLAGTLSDLAEVAPEKAEARLAALAAAPAAADFGDFHDFEPADGSFSTTVSGYQVPGSHVDPKAVAAVEQAKLEADGNQEALKKKLTELAMKEASNAANHRSQ